MEHYLLAAAVCGLAAALVAAAVLLVRERQITARLRLDGDRLRHGLRLREEELAHLVSARLPERMEVLHGRPVTVPGPLHGDALAGTAFAARLHAVTELFTGAVEHARDRAGQSAKVTLKAMMRTVQSLANEQQLALSTMQERHDDPDVLEDLLRLDHMNAQLGRRAQATAVLCGSWPGQQRSASSLDDVVRGATSRIRDYLRVRITTEVNVAVVGRAVEPVVLALAELLDNAARHSQPSTPVEVNFQSAHNGVAVVVDDAGVAMDAEETRHAARLLSGRESVDIHRLGDPPQVGFAVMGVLSARYGFSVSVDTRSPYGGVRAVVFLPTVLLTAVDATPGGPPAATAAPVTEPVAAVAEPGGPPPTASGLPKRRRVDAADDPAPAPAAAEQPSRPARQTAAGMGAWQRGTRSGRATGTPATDPSDIRGDSRP